MTRSPHRRPVAAIILAAGKSTRMKSDVPKVLHKLAGRPVLGHVLDSVDRIGVSHTVVVVGPGGEDVAALAGDRTVAVQTGQSGTGDALRVGLAALGPFDGDVLMLFGDTPLVRPQTFEALLAARAAAADPAVAVLGMRPADTLRYGRLILGPSGGLEDIVEFADASPEQRAMPLCNGGLMAFDGARLPGLIGQLTDDNAKGEYYATDLVRIARRSHFEARHVEVAEAETMGIDTRIGLARAEAILQGRLRTNALEAGVTLMDPGSVFLSADTTFGRDCLIEPHVFLGPGVSLGDGVTVRAFSHLEAVRVGPKCQVGPFARMRGGAVLAEQAKVGNFVEVKNADLGVGVKINHLAYVGDAEIGARTNVGAGTITCNYDGFAKHRTKVGQEVFVGSNTALVAPVTVGDRASIAAGSVITSDVPEDGLAIGRARQEVKEGRAPSLRARLEARKAARDRKGG